MKSAVYLNVRHTPLIGAFIVFFQIVVRCEAEIRTAAVVLALAARMATRSIFTLKRLLQVISLIALTAGHASSQSDGAPLHIGVTLPLTGPAAAYGVAAMNGFELARARDPRRFTRIRFHYEDTQLKPANAVQAFNSLRRYVQPIAHFDFGSATSLALAPLAEQRRLLLISSAYDPVVSRGRHYVYRFANNTDEYAVAILSSLRQRGIKRITLIVADNPFFVQFAASLEALAHEDEYIQIHTVRPEESDFGPISLRLRHGRSSPEALGLLLFLEQAAQLLRKTRTSQRFEFLFGTDAFEEVSPAHPDAALFEGISFPNSTVTADFLGVYRAEYGNTSHYTFAAGTYDLANLLAEASERCIVCDQAEFIKALEEPVSRHGALGNYRFNSSPSTGKNFVSKIVMKMIQRDGLVVAQRSK